MRKNILENRRDNLRMTILHQSLVAMVAVLVQNLILSELTSDFYLQKVG